MRRALETLEAEETWTEEERCALDEKIDRALAQVTAGKVYGPEEARDKLAALRETPLKRTGDSLDLFQLTEEAILDIDAIWLISRNAKAS